MLPSLPKFALDSHLIFVLPSLSISRYFCKDSLMTPPPQHTTPLQASLLLLLPLQKFSSYHFLHFPFVFIRVPFVFTRVHSCSFVFIRVLFVFTRVHSCSLVFHSCSTRVHSCSFVFHSCSLVFTRVHSCSFVFVRVRSCSFVFRSVWCFRYDRRKSLFRDNYLAQTRLCEIINSALGMLIHRRMGGGGHFISHLLTLESKQRESGASESPCFSQMHSEMRLSMLLQKELT